MTNAQMTKTVDKWTSQQKENFITEVKSIVESDCAGYVADDVIQVVLVGSYVWGTPTVESDVDILVEVAKREYKRYSMTHSQMADGKKLSIKIRDRLKKPKLDSHLGRWDLSTYSLSNNQTHVGADDEAFNEWRNA